MILLKQSTAATLLMGPFVDDTDGKTAETALTISQADIRLSKNGGDLAQTNNSAGATHDEKGYYAVPLDTTDTSTLGRLRVLVSESGALPVWVDCLVVPANVYDSLVLGTDYLQSDAVQLEGSDTSDTIATLATAAALTTVDGIVDSILEDTGTTLPATLATIDGIVDDILVDTGTTLPAAISTPPSAATIADAVWDEALSGHTTAGSAGKALGDAPTASQLTAATATGAVNTAITGSYEVTVGTTWTASITGLGDMTSRTALYVAVKTAIDDTDDEAIIRWTEGTGLTRLSGSATTSSYGTIAVDDASDGDITITLTEDGTGGLSGDLGTGLTLAVKCIKSGEIWEKYGTDFDIVDGWIDATS